MPSYHRNLYFLGFSTWAMFVLFGCSDSRIAQCQKIVQISQNMSQLAQSSRHSQDPQKIEETAGQFADSAKQLDALSLSDSTLASYEKELSSVYQSYSESTVLMLKALKGKDIKTARLAKLEVIKTSNRERTVGQQISQYCQVSG